ncbi:MAG TPA: hypothetical protein VFT87_00735 [Candidatus Saccharimonadales bacterium]|nr:hypothetical protein [Candidatus Saccharimonadales bacterium]
MGGESKLTIEALQGAIGKGLPEKDLQELYCEFRRHLLVKGMRSDGLVMEIALNVAGHAIEIMGLAGKAADRQRDEHGYYIEGFMPLFSDEVSVRIRESGTMEAPVAFSIVTPGRRLFRWVPPSLASQLNRLPVLIVQPQKKPSAPKAAATPQSGPEKAWGKPGPGGVDLKYLETEYARLAKTVYGGKFPANSAVAVISWTVASTLMNDNLPFERDPNGDRFVARATLCGRLVDIYLEKGLLPEGKKIGFRIRNIPGQPPEKSEWWWPGVKLEEVTSPLADSARKVGKQVATGVKARAAGLADRLKRKS